jgi:hypothetical protein
VRNAALPAKRVQADFRFPCEHFTLFAAQAVRVKTMTVMQYDSDAFRRKLLQNAPARNLFKRRSFK